jgi:hypothetical protein
MANDIQAYIMKEQMEWKGFEFLAAAATTNTAATAATTTTTTTAAIVIEEMEHLSSDMEQQIECNKCDDFRLVHQHWHHYHHLQLLLPYLQT